MPTSNSGSTATRRRVGARAVARAANLVDGYHTRWNVTDPVNALGAVPPRGT